MKKLLATISRRCLIIGGVGCFCGSKSAFARCMSVCGSMIFDCSSVTLVEDAELIKFAKYLE